MPTRPRRLTIPANPRAVRHPRRIVIKFFDGSLGSGGQPPSAAVQLLDLLRQQNPEIGFLTPLFDPGQWGQIADEQNKAIALDPSYAPRDFATYWRVSIGSTVPAQPLLATLRGLTGVELAYLEPAGSGPADPDFLAVQQHFHAAPEGVGLPTAMAAGAFGGGITIADVERGWDVTHTEFMNLLAYDAAAGLPVVASGVPQLDGDDQDHGTNVLGILFAQTNGQYLDGAAPGATIDLHSYVAADGSENIAAAVMNAALALAYGDVLLIEVQITDDAEFPAFVNMPAELAPAVFAAVRLATALGITVVAAAGNGDADLELPIVADPGGWTVLDRADPAFQDSGAILVAAGTRQYSGSSKPLSGTNYGNRVDAFAIGENVSTTAHLLSGESGLPFRMVNGTSPAAAIVAGVSAVIQGVAKASLAGQPYSAWQLRWLLTASGYATPSADPAADRIGRMPDLGKLLAEAALPATPDVYLRDHLGDVGLVHAGALSNSPDLILRQSAAADPEAEFGLTSGHLDDLTLHQEAVAAAKHWIYARVWNRGGADAAGAAVRIWWAEPATLIHPNDWNLIGDVDVPTIPSASVKIADALEWPAAPAAGHYCFLAVADHAADPAPAVPDFAAIAAAGYDAWSVFKSFLRRINNATWRNFDVLPAAAGSVAKARAHAFLVRGAFDRARRMRLTLRFVCARDASVTVRLPQEFWDLADPESRPAGVKCSGRVAVLTVAAGSDVVLDADLPAGSAYSLELVYALTAADAAGAEFHAIQAEHPPELLGGDPEELGRVSWLWTAKPGA